MTPEQVLTKVIAERTHYCDPRYLDPTQEAFPGQMDYARGQRDALGFVRDYLTGALGRPAVANTTRESYSWMRGYLSEGNFRSPALVDWCRNGGLHR